MITRGARAERSTAGAGAPRGFTLIELLVVILIILLVSAVALPTVLPAINHRQVSEAARILQGALVGARDKAIHDGQPSGIRLLPDPAFPINWTPSGAIDRTTILAYNRIVPIEPAPEYTEGFCTTVPPAAIATLVAGGTYRLSPHVHIRWPSFPYSAAAPFPGLLLVQSPADPARNGSPTNPTSWFWNIRIGDKVQLNNTGPWYTVIGPMYTGPNVPASGTGGVNPDLFVNAGNPAALSTLVVPQINTATGATSSTGFQHVEFLILVNGRDDNGNGWIDEQWDGVDNDGNGPTDYLEDTNEFEQETWLGAISTSSVLNITYTIKRRPAPALNARAVELPTSMVIDATTAFFQNLNFQGAVSDHRERSRLPASNPLTQYTGNIDIVLNPDGTVVPTMYYSTPSSYGMDQAFYHFWLAERQDLMAVQTDANGNVQPLFSGAPYILPIAQPGGNNTNGYAGPYLKGDYSVVTLNARTGQLVTNANPPFLDASGNYNTTYPFIQAEQGVSGGP
jgi:prepilin-type N-terminal cleavage/methylation domain-containing protein